MRRQVSLEPIQEVGIHGQRVDLVNRRSMRRIIARRMKAATVAAWRSKSRARRRLRLIQAKARSTIHRLGNTANLCSSLRLTISMVHLPVEASMVHLPVEAGQAITDNEAAIIPMRLILTLVFT